MFITFEGIDGSGKTTLAQSLAAALERSQEVKQQVVLTRDPGGTAIGEAVRDVLRRHLPDMSHRTQSLLFMASRSDLVEKVIRPALQDGCIVICDRFQDSTRVYQQPHWPPVKAAIDSIEIDVGPDITFLLDLPPEEAYRRMLLRAETAESSLPDPEIRRLEAIRGRYHELAQACPRTHVVGVQKRSVEEITEELLHIVLEVLPKSSR